MHFVFVSLLDSTLTRSLDAVPTPLVRQPYLASMPVAKEVSQLSGPYTQNHLFKESIANFGPVEV